MAIFLTIFTGVSVFVFGQILLKMVIDPIHELKKVIAEISNSMIEYAGIFSNPGKNETEKEVMVSKLLRKLSSKLNANIYLVPFYDKSSKLFGLPSKTDIEKATKHLIGLSNGFNDSKNRDAKNSYLAQHVKDALGIHISENDRLSPELEMELYK